MPLASNLQRQDYQYKYQTLQGVWRWVTRLDLSQTVPVYEVRDILSPYGLLRDSIPIPGDIILAMQQSIDELSQAFAPSMYLSASSLSFIVDEGRGFSEAQQVQLSNDGVYGSLLSAQFITTDAYLRVSPSTLGALSFNEGGVVDVTVDSTSLVAAGSPYTASITVQDPRATNNPLTIAVDVTVRPKAHVDVAPTSLTFTVTKPLTGPFPAIPSQTFILSNTGPAGSVLDYIIQRLTGCCNWLIDISPYTGQVAGGGSQNVVVTVAPPESLLVGTYQETLRISGYSDNSYADVLVTLEVT